MTLSCKSLLASETVFHSVCHVWLSSRLPELFTLSYCTWSWNWLIVSLPYLRENQKPNSREPRGMLGQNLKASLPANKQASKQATTLLNIPLTELTTCTTVSSFIVELMFNGTSWWEKPSKWYCGSVRAVTIAMAADATLGVIVDAPQHPPHDMEPLTSMANR